VEDTKFISKTSRASLLIIYPRLIQKQKKKRRPQKKLQRKPLKKRRPQKKLQRKPQKKRRLQKKLQ
jgi:hypothetical protein